MTNHETLTDVLTRIMSMDSGAMIKIRLKHPMEWQETYQFQPLTTLIIELYAESRHLDYIAVRYLGREEVYSNDRYVKHNETSI